jgi:hypothetical protein
MPEMLASATIDLHRPSHPIPGSDEHQLDPLANSCCICHHEYSLATMNSEAEHPVQLPCGHVFGTTCIETWAQINSTCPLCRAHIHIHHEVDTADLSLCKIFSWQGGVDAGIDADGELEAGSVEHFDAQENFGTPEPALRCQLDKDVWLAVAIEETSTGYMPSKFDSASGGTKTATDIWIDDVDDFIEQYTIFGPYSYYLATPPTTDFGFEELLGCHEQWMIDSLNGEEASEEFCVSYFDVFTC